MKIEYATFSETGKRRANQDVCRVIEMPENNRVLMIVCDGMGATPWAMWQPRRSAMLSVSSGEIATMSLIRKRRL